MNTWLNGSMNFSRCPSCVVSAAYHRSLVQIIDSPLFGFLFVIAQFSIRVFRLSKPPCTNSIFRLYCQDDKSRCSMKNFLCGASGYILRINRVSTAKAYIRIVGSIPSSLPPIGSGWIPRPQPFTEPFISDCHRSGSILCFIVSSVSTHSYVSGHPSTMSPIVINMSSSILNSDLSKHWRRAKYPPCMSPIANVLITLH